MQLFNIFFQYPKALTKIFSFGKGICHVLAFSRIPPYLYKRDYMLLKFQVTAIGVQEK